MSFMSNSTSYMFGSISKPLALPATFGFWVKLSSVFSTGFGSVFTWYDGNPSDSFEVYLDGSQRLNFEAYFANTVAIAASGTSSVSLDGWCFVLLRLMSPGGGTTLFYDIIYPDRSLEQHNINTFFDFSNQLNAMGLFVNMQGSLATSPGFPGVSLADFWITNSDINSMFGGGSGAALDPTLVYELAYRGPAWFPHVYKDLVYYNDMRSWVDPKAMGNLNAPGMRRRQGNTAMDSWNVIGTIATDQSPPLPYYYERPANFMMSQPSIIV